MKDGVVNQGGHANREARGKGNDRGRIRMYLRPLKKHVLMAQRMYRRRTPGTLRFPDFMGVGFGQAGSTWIVRNLSCHSRVFIPSIKETHYLDRFFDCWWLFSYRVMFEGDARQLITAGELTPSYTLLRPNRIQIIRELMSDVRLFLMIRHPVDRAWPGARNTLSKLGTQQRCMLEELGDDEYDEYSSKEWRAARK